MNKLDVNTIEVNGIEYVRADSVNSNQLAEKVDGLEYCLVRTYSAGVFAGFVKERNGQEALVLNARRIWYWDGAASLSQLSVDGTSKPENCKFPCTVERVVLTNVIEVLPCTKKAKQSIEGVEVWEQ